MSMTKRYQEASRWLASARDDHRAAKAMLGHAMYSHAGFLSQQAGEKAVKALYFALDQDPWGHSILRLIEGIDADHLQDLKDHAVALDKLYITTRYPDALPGLTPAEAFTEEEAKRALDSALILLEAVEPLILSP